MANIDAKLKVAELDFDTIKDNLKNYLKSQPEFSDYNFEGSGLSVLLDLLAYNTNYMGYYLNMVANEMFLDTALSRKSVVSHAKLLGYTPRSVAAARATINVAFTPVSSDSNSAILIPRFTRFLSESKDGINYVFVTTSSRVVSKNNQTGLFETSNLEVKEGQPLALSFSYNSQTNPKQVFVLPESNIDISTLQVVVQRSAENSNSETYVLAQDATNVGADSAVYYIEENKNGKYQIYFGDGIIGKSLVEGNIVIVSYIVSSGLLANGIKTFKLVDAILPGSSVSVTTNQESTAGAFAEDIESIRMNAPKSFIAQNRAVTKNDYIALVNRDYPYFEAVNVWGGEENDPPVYGKVFFTAKPLGNYEITETEIEYVKNSILKPFSVLTVTPEYVPADYNFLNIVSTVYYDPTKTTKTLDEISATVFSAINGFAAQNLNRFNSTFRVSQLSRAIDDSDYSISSNDVEITLEKRFTVDITKSTTYTLNFGTALAQGTTNKRISSTPSFTYLDTSGVNRECYLEEVLQSYTGIESIDVNTSGGGYTTVPSVMIDGDGTGAKARALIVNGRVKRIEVTDPGTGYTTAVARLVGGGGSGATLRVNLQGKTGKLRIYYYDTNQLKKTISEDAGDINYQTGVVVLRNFAPTAISDPFGTLVLRAIPLNKIFTSTKNMVITLDSSDPSAVRTVIAAVV
jgi:hypothetical protein